MQAVVRSTSHNHTQVLDRRDHSGLMLAARISLAHFLLRGCHPALGKRVVGDGGGRPDGRGFPPRAQLPTNGTNIVFEISELSTLVAVCTLWISRANVMRITRVDAHGPRCHDRKRLFLCVKSLHQLVSRRRLTFVDPSV